MLYPKWELPLRQARQETNQHKLLNLISEAEMAIFHRFQELPENADDLEESRAMLAACHELMKLKAERLNSPSLPGERPESRAQVDAHGQN
jgi:hypothetical protein